MRGTQTGILALSAALFLFNILSFRALWAHDYAKNLIELTVFLSALNLFTRISCVEQFIKILPSAYKLFIAFFFFAAVTGQTLGKSEITFPFPCWDMYQKKIEIKNAKYYHYVAVTDQGEEFHLNPTQIYPSLSRMRHDVLREWRIDAYLNAASSAPQDSDESTTSAGSPGTNLKTKIFSTLRGFFENKNEISQKSREDQLKTSARTVAQAYQKRNKDLHIKSLKIIHGFLAKNENHDYKEIQHEILNFPLEEN
jgi:hypothetical protein